MVENRSSYERIAVIFCMFIFGRKYKLEKIMVGGLMIKTENLQNFSKMNTPWSMGRVKRGTKKNHQSQ